LIYMGKTRHCPVITLPFGYSPLLFFIFTVNNNDRFSPPALTVVVSFTGFQPILLPESHILNSVKASNNSMGKLWMNSGTLYSTLLEFEGCELLTREL